MLQDSFQEILIEAGCDEAGRGPLVGPVTAAAVILPKGWNNAMLNDSKQMSHKNLCLMREVIEREAIAWAVEMVSAEEIDRINILNASFAAMSRAITQLKITPELLLIDGNRFKTKLNIPFHCIVKGDAKFTSIAAASVLAKTHRDEYMCRLDEQFPEYNWRKNKGYPTAEHRAAITRYGITPHHRLSFNHSQNSQLSLFDSEKLK